MPGVDSVCLIISLQSLRNIYLDLSCLSLLVAMGRNPGYSRSIALVLLFINISFLSYTLTGEVTHSPCTEHVVVNFNPFNTFFHK
jgi:hypothetical protein